MTRELEPYESELNAVGWTVLRFKDGVVGTIRLPGGEVIWIDGTYQGVKHSGYLRPCDGMVILHGSSEADDCHVSEFVKRVPVPVVVAVPEKPKQGLLF